MLFRSIHVLQGEREFAGDNRTLGRFNLTGIPPAPRGVPQVEVTFNIDVNGILHVSAKDMASGKQQSIEIKGSSGLDQGEIDQMRKDAESHAEEDRKRRELVDTKNQSDQLAWSTEKMLKEQGEKVSAEDRGQIESALNQLREANKGDDLSSIKRAMENLQKASHKVAEEMYKNAAGAQQAGPGGQAPQGDPGGPGAKPAGPNGAGKGDDDVIDAEYEVKE